MRTLTLAFLLALWASAAPSAQAQDAASDPCWRVDVALPRAGAMHVARAAGASHDAATGEVELRAVHRSGHGFAARGAIAMGGTDYFPLLEGDYVYRITLAGDARLGLAFDLSGGLSAGWGDDCVGWFGCTDGAAVDGLRAGGNVGSTLVFHAYGFTVDLALRYRGLMPTETPEPHEILELEHALSAALGLGFGFW